MAPINVGLMGYGFSTKCFHLPFIEPNQELIVYAFLQRAKAPVDTINMETGVHVTADYPHTKHYRTTETFFADPAIELVIICTNVETHAEFAEQALLAGKHVVVEKPFTVTSTEADHLIATAEKTGKVLTCFQNRRYDGDFRTISQLMSRRAFGKITECEIHYDADSPAWVSKWDSPGLIPGEGMLYGLGSHTLDQALQLFGRPHSVTAFLRTLRNIDSETDDAFTVVLQYDGNQKDLLVTVKTTIVSPMERQMKLFVRGTEGSFLKFDEDLQADQVMAGMLSTDSTFGIEDSASYGLLSTVQEYDAKIQTFDNRSKKYIGKWPTTAGRYLSYYEDVVAAIRGKADLRVKPEQARDVIRLIELARESHKKRVSVPWS
ncbi:hypothetical protein MMC34_007013 [Xylographa carneopallida]|nr:hypothetical protein [Xylographa carneopallida]